MQYFYRFIQFIILSMPVLAIAGIDQNKLVLSEQFNHTLRWDNVESGPLWIDGIAPVRNHDWDMDSVRLESNEDITVRVPAGSELRLFNPEDKR